MEQENLSNGTPSRNLEDKPAEYRHDVLVERNGDGAVEVAVEEELEFPKLSDRVADRLVRKGLVTSEQAEEAYNEWKRLGEQDLFWRTLARHPAINRDQVFAEAALIYAFRETDLEEFTPDKAFVEQILSETSKELQDKMFLFRILPLGYEFDKSRGIQRLILVTHDPGRQESIDLVHQLISSILVSSTCDTRRNRRSYRSSRRCSLAETSIWSVSPNQTMPSISAPVSTMAKTNLLMKRP